MNCLGFSTSEAGGTFEAVGVCKGPGNLLDYLLLSSISTVETVSLRLLLLFLCSSLLIHDDEKQQKVLKTKPLTECFIK